MATKRLGILFMFAFCRFCQISLEFLLKYITLRIQVCVPSMYSRANQSMCKPVTCFHSKNLVRVWWPAYKPSTELSTVTIPQLTAYKLVLIWLNNDLITDKWPSINETNTLQSTNLMSRCQVTLSDTCTTYYCHSHWHTVCILIGWYVHHDVIGLSSSPPTA